jgi:hypothetical protein
MPDALLYMCVWAAVCYNFQIESLLQRLVKRKATSLPTFIRNVACFLATYTWTVTSDNDNIRSVARLVLSCISESGLYFTYLRHRIRKPGLPTCVCPSLNGLDDFHRLNT